MHLLDNIDVEDSVTVDVDGEGHIIGLETLDAAKRFGLDCLLKVSIEKLPLEKHPSRPPPHATNRSHRTTRQEI